MATSPTGALIATLEARLRRHAEIRTALFADLDGLIAKMRSHALAMDPRGEVLNASSVTRAPAVSATSTRWADDLAVLVQRHREPTGPP